MRTPELLYLYGVVNAGADAPPPDLHGLDGGQVQLVVAGSLAGITSLVSGETYGEAVLDERLRDMVWVGARALAHERVLTWFADRGAVVPLTLFSLHADEARLRERLAEREPALLASLARVSGHQEWGIRVWREEPAFAARVDALSDRIRELSAAIAAAPRGRGFLLEKKREGLRSEEARRLSRERAQETMDRLRECSAAGVVLPLAAPLEPSTERTLILHAAFLVAEPRYDTFQSAVRALAASGQDDGFTYEFTGPWPPYHFASF